MAAAQSPNVTLQQIRDYQLDITVAPDMAHVRPGEGPPVRHSDGAPPAMPLRAAVALRSIAMALSRQSRPKVAAERVWMISTAAVKSIEWPCRQAVCPRAMDR